MPAPVNVRLRTPTIGVTGWPAKAARWAALNSSIGGNPDFYPLTIKAAYVIGIIHDVCTSVSRLVKVPRSLVAATYLPAVGVCASGMEVLGRCVLGVDTTQRADESLRTGFKWLVNSAYTSVPDSHVLVRTTTNAFDILTLPHLRHFAAHGQATAQSGSPLRQLQDLDTELLAPLPPLIAAGLERWWGELQVSDEMCNRLAKANIIAFRSWPVFKMWGLFEQDAQGQYHTITDAFAPFDWKVP